MKKPEPFRLATQLKLNLFSDSEQEKQLRIPSNKAINPIQLLSKSPAQTIAKLFLRQQTDRHDFVLAKPKFLIEANQTQALIFQQIYGFQRNKKASGTLKTPNA